MSFPFCGTRSCGSKKFGYTYYPIFGKRLFCYQPAHPDWKWLDVHLAVQEDGEVFRDYRMDKFVAAVTKAADR